MTTLQGYEIAPLSKVAVLVRGVTYARDEARDEPFEGYVPLLRATNITDRLETDTGLVYAPKESFVFSSI